MKKLDTSQSSVRRLRLPSTSYCLLTTPRRRAFTLIELVIVIAIIAAASLTSFLLFYSRRNVADLTSAKEQLVAIIRQAQSRSASQFQNVAWGVHVANPTSTVPFYALFSNSYATATTEAYYRLPPSVGMILVPSGLVGYWPLDEYGGNAVRDYSGNGNTGNWQGISQWIPGRVGTHAGQFNGAGYVSASPISLPRFTVSAWVKPNGNQVGTPSIVADAYPSYVNYTIAFNPGTTSVWGGIYNAAWFQTASVALTSNVWSFVLMTYDGTNLTLYVNGSLASSVAASVTPQSSGTELRIGRRWDNPDYVNGGIDDVRIYNRALSPAEITQLYKESADVIFSPIIGGTTSTGIELYSLSQPGISSTISVAPSGAVSF